MRIAVICNDKWHPATSIEQGLQTVPLDGGPWEFFLDTVDPSRIPLCDFDAVLLTKSNCRSVDDPRPWLTPEVQQQFVDYVEGGRGLLVVHSGTVGYSDQAVFRDLVGGVFTHHPEQCDVTVRITARSEVTGPDLAPFTTRDEHYFMQVTARDLNVFMTSMSTHGVQPAGWTRRQGAGRVCVLTPGHNVEVWQRPDYANILARAVQWCADGV